MSPEGAKNVSRPWSSLLQIWGSVTMTFAFKFVYMAHHFIFLRLSPLGLSIDREELWFHYSVSKLRVSLSTEGAKNVSLPRLSLLQGWGSVTMTSTGKFVYMAHHFILLRLHVFGLGVDRKGGLFEHCVS